MTRSEIIELAWQLTERKGERVLDPQTLFRFVVQDIAKRQRFWWRRKVVNLTLEIGTTTYDLTSVSTTPSLSELLFEEITKVTIITSANPYQTADLTPIFIPEGIIAMLNNSQTAQPGRYTFGQDDYKTIRIDPPDSAYSMYIAGWLMPDPASESTTDSVPLIPPWGHNTIVSGLCWRIFKFAYGSKNEKAMDAQAEYEQGIQDLGQKREFDPNYRLQLASSEAAVRST